MRKSIAYYLQDPARLREISDSELREWAADEPYSQPLRKLIQLRAEMNGEVDEQVLHDNAAYHVIDLDRITEAADTERVEREVEVLQAITHSLASDTLEELVEYEIAEELYHVASVIHAAMGEVGSAIVSTTAEEVPAIAIDDDYTLVQDNVGNAVLKDIRKFEAEPASDTDLSDHDVSLPIPAAATEEAESDLLALESDTGSKDEEPLEPEIEGDTIVEYDEEKLMVASDGNEVVEVAAEKEATQVIALAEQSKDKKKSKRKKKATSKVTKKQKATSGKSASDKAKDKKEKKAQKGTVVKLKKKSETTSKRKKKKGQKKRYIYLEEPSRVQTSGGEQSSSAYDGDSDYIKWLMKTKPINEESEVVAKKKKNKEKKSKKADKVKKSIVLKTAAESVKKKDVIISETLADILAAQGHSKKAKKMYKHLSLIFPEKSTIFAAKIKKLKKK